MIFISYSTRNRATADNIFRLLVEADHRDVFLAHREEDGIPLGKAFDAALHEALQRTTTMLALLSAEWIASTWCRAEYQTALLAGKRIVPVLLGDPRSLDIPAELARLQGVELWRDPDHAKQTLFGMLARVVSDRLSSLHQFRDALASHADRSIYDLPFGQSASILDWYVSPTIVAEPRSSGGAQDADSLLRDGAGGARFQVVIGPAGIGKSTLLKYLAARALPAPQAVDDGVPLEPLFIRLRDLAETNEGTLGERMIQALRRLPRFNYAGNAISSDFLTSWRAASGRTWLFLLDALDEVPADRMRDLGILLQDLRTAWPDARFIITTRTKEMVERAFDSDERVDTYDIDPPTSAQATRIAERWSTRAAGSRVTSWLDEVGEIAGTPLGISMMAIVESDEHPRMRNKAVLYGAFVDKLVEGLKRRGEPMKPLVGDGIAVALLQTIADVSYRQGMSIDEDAITEKLAPQLVALNLSSKAERAEIDARHWLRLLIDHVGLFDGAAWRHVSFCEFLAARGMSRRFAPDGLDTLTLIQSEFRAGRDGLVAFLFAHWRAALKCEDDAAFAKFRPCIEVLLGKRRYPSWWQRLFRRGSQPVRTPPSEIDGEQAAQVCGWIADLGGVPADVEEDAFALMMTAQDDIATRTLNLCRNLFSDEGRRGLHVVRRWHASERLRRSLEPWMRQWLDDVRRGNADDEVARGRCVVLMQLREDEAISALIRESDPAVHTTIVAALRDSDGHADRFWHVLVEAAQEREQRALQHFAETTATTELLHSFQLAPYDNVVSKWAAEYPTRPFAADVLALTTSFGAHVRGVAVVRDALDDVSTRLLAKRLPRMQKALGTNASETGWSWMECFLTAFDLEELDQMVREPTLPEALRTYLRWRAAVRKSGGKGDMRALWVSYILEFIPSVGAPARIKHELRPCVSQNVLLEWLGGPGCLDSDRALLSMSDSSRNDLDRHVAAILVDERVRRSAKLALIESQLAWAREHAAERVDELSAQMLSSYGDWLQVNPDDASVLRARSVLLKSMDRCEEALHDAELAAEFWARHGQPLDDDFLELRARLRWLMGRFDDALQDIDEVLLRDDTNAFRWYLRAITLSDLQRPREAILSCRRATECGSEDPRVYKEMAQCMSALGMLDDALAALARALELHGDDGAPVGWLELHAWLLSCAGRDAESVVVLAGFEAGDSFEIDAANIQNALLRGDRAVARQLCQAREDRDDPESWFSVLTLIAFEGEDRDDLLAVLTDRLGTFPYDGDKWFWKDVLRNDQQAVARDVESMIAAKNDAALRWISSDSRMLRAFVPDWVQALAGRANDAASVIAIEALAAITLPSTPREAAQQDPPLQRAQRVIQLYPQGMLCQESGIEGYDVEQSIAEKILRAHFRATLVLIPLPGRPYLYAQANRKWDAGSNFDFKLCLPFHASLHYEHLAGVVVQKRIRRVVVTDVGLHERLQQLAPWSAVLSRIVLEEHSLPYTAVDVVYVE